MGISLYEGISRHELDTPRTTSEGKTYTINHPNQLIVDMRYKGTDCANANSQGWERNSSYYFKELKGRHPEYFSKKNNILIDSGRSPIIDKKFSDNFPQYKNYKGETMVHHHIGQDGQAVALPQSVHKGYGEIHTVEHELGITEKAEVFSKSCENACKKNPTLYGQTSDKFKSFQNEKINLSNRNSTTPAKNSIRGATHTANSGTKSSSSNSHVSAVSQNR